MTRRIKQLIFSATMLLLTATTVMAAEPVSIQVQMPALACGKGVLEPNECVLSGILRVRGSEALNGPLRYFCDIRYTYIAGGSDNQSIRFTGRVLHHGEVAVEKGRGRKELIAPLTLKLSSGAKQIEVAEIGCERE